MNTNIKYHIDTENIKKIINKLKKYSKDDIHFSSWYKSKTLSGRDMDHEEILKTYFEFDKVYFIEEEILKLGDIGFDIYYKLSNTKTLVIGISLKIKPDPKKKPISFIHAYPINRKWQGIIKWRTERF